MNHHSASIFTLLALILMFSMLSCKNSRMRHLEGIEGRYMAKITTSAGDHIDHLENDTLQFLTFPFNVAEFTGNRLDKKKVFIVGKSIESGKKVSIHPFAKLTYNDGEEKVAIIARPTNPQLVTVHVDNYYDLISTYYGVQRVIETWLTYSKGFASLQTLSWDNEDKAVNYLEM